MWKDYHDFYLNGLHDVNSTMNPIERQIKQAEYDAVYNSLYSSTDYTDRPHYHHRRRKKK